MKRYLTLQSTCRRSAGVGLVTAIFLLVVLAGLGVAMVTIFSSQQIASAMDEQGARAYQAARAGVEWGVFQKLRNDNCAAETTFAMPAGTSLSGLTATVSCAQLGDDEDPLARWVITSVACNQPGADGRCPNVAPTRQDYVARRLEAQI